ncbi:MAG: hypothetical protein ACHQ7N_06685 [Candidatus Methylomirabilales bacterium]
MDILQFNELDPTPVAAQFERVVERLRAGDFRAADVRKLAPTPYYRARLNDADRLLFRMAAYQGRKHLLLLEIIRNHAYEKSRFLNGAMLDEGKLVPLPDPAAVPDQDALPLRYVNPSRREFHVLDKILSFDEAQAEVFGLRPPFILIGTAGSGKTVLSLEKLKQLTGDILYVTRSPFLVENARDLYYAVNYENEKQTLEFLSFQEYLESIRVPAGRPVTFRDFERWFTRYSFGARIKDAHRLFEEFGGVLTGADIEKPYLSREEYLGLGIRRSIFTDEERPLVYDIFLKYLEFLEGNGFYDPNLAAHATLRLVQPRYDFAVVDEVQDLTNVQLCLILRSLRSEEHFVLCGDSNQLVHPNFFSWTNTKTMFYHTRADGLRGIMRVLNTNYRNSPQVTELANRLLLVKHARFGSIDRESSYLVRCNAEGTGTVELMPDDDKVRRELSAKTSRSARTAVMVMRGEDKAEARRHFQTPLLFSIQEAKGLEYENIILFNFVSGSPRAFDEITEGVTADELSRDPRYARAKDKADKSLDAFKFYINALYVAITRAIGNLYLIEHNPSHRLLGLLGLAAKREGVRISEHCSSAEEWKAEARRLELQGKAEQAEAIRRNVLAIQDVSWKILTPVSLEALEQEALDPARYNRQAKQLLFEYAVLYNVPALIDQLVGFNFNRARNAARELPAVERKYHQDYTERSFHALYRKIGLYGVDFRNPLNQTPLMIAARLGLTPLIQALIRDGANPHLVDNWGRNPLQIALRQAYLDERYARTCIGQAYPALAPSSIRIRIDDRLTKIDNHRPEFFLLNSMLAVAQDILREKIRHKIPAFQTGDFVEALAHFPDHVTPPWRKHRQHITAVLARHEIFREDPYNRKLFLRVHRGYYILNPRMEVEVNDAWVNVYDLLQIEHLEKEKDNPRLQQFVEYVRRWQKVLAAAPAPVSSEPGAALPASDTQPPLPRVVEPRPEGEPGGDFPVDEGLAAPDPASAPPIEASDQAGQLPLFPDGDPLF